MKEANNPAAGEPSVPMPPFVLRPPPATGFLILVAILIVLQLAGAALVAYQFWKIVDLEQRIERLQEDVKQGKPPPQGEP
jgi:hypothetical protein